MPGGDRTGPMGMGAMTGRAVGYCVGSGMPGHANPGPGRGSGGGPGRGRGGGGWGRGGGRGWWNVAQPDTLRRELDQVNARLAALESGLRGDGEGVNR